MRELSEEKKTGITIAIKTISKNYPFIVGWEFAEGWYKYEFTTYVNLIINLDSLSKFFNRPLREERGSKSPSLSYFLSLWKLGMTDEEKKEWDDNYEYFYQKKEEILKKINTVYSQLPTEYIMFPEDDTESPPAKISIDMFLSE